jgi:transcription elongation factor GreA
LIQLRLVAFARQRQVDELDRAWEQCLAAPADFDTTIYCQTIEALVQHDLGGRALDLATRMVEALAGSGRVGDAATLAWTVVRHGAHNDKLTKRLFGFYEQMYAAEDWYQPFRDRAKLREDNLAQSAFEEFERLRAFTRGNVVYHRAGWGEGVVEHLDMATQELRIKFGNGRTSEVPLSSAMESMVALPADDLRAMKLVGIDELRRLAAKSPSMLIHKAARVYRGRISSTEFKDQLSPSVIPTKEWPAFWKRVRAAATTDPFLQIEGSSARPVFVLRKKPLGLADEARLAMRHADDLGGEIAVCRDYLARCEDDDARNTILDLVQERVETTLAEKAAGTKSQKPASHAHILDGILLLENMGRPTAATAESELRLLLHDSNGEFRPEAFDRLATQEARTHAIQLMPKALGDNWTELCTKALTRTPATVVEQIVDLLVEHGKASNILALWQEVAPYPQRHPVLTYLFGKLHADGVFEGMEDAPDAVTVGRVLLHLVRVLSTDKKEAAKTRLKTRATSLMTGRRSILQKALESIGRDDLRTYLGITERGGEDFPQEISDMILRAAVKKYPELIAKAEKPYWELDHVYSTRVGLAAQKEEYRKLVEEKIPTNSKAIGAAAALGDLSENSEWESAMEEQRNLTGRAAMMDQELRKVRLIEDQQVPDDIVAPGTAVTLTYVDTGKTVRMRVLGPWDLGEDVLNYRAPLAKPLLGRTVGEEFELTTGAGSDTIRIDKIEKIV